MFLSFLFSGFDPSDSNLLLSVQVIFRYSIHSEIVFNNFYLVCKLISEGVLTISQYNLNEIIQKIKEKSPFDFKEEHRGKARALRVIVSKLYYSLDYKNEPQATREKVTQLLLYHAQFSREEIDKTFAASSRETTEYSIEFLKQHPELARVEAQKTKEFPDEEDEELNTSIEVLEKLTETKYIFPHYT